MGNKNTIIGNPPANQPVAQWATAPQVMSVSVTGTNTYNSGPIAAGNKDNIGLQVVFTGTMTGTFSITVTNNPAVVGDTLSFNPVIVQPTGSSMEFSVSLNQLPFPYYTINYVNSSGSGTLVVTQSAKDLN
jgi:hypothetical protein